MTACTILRVGGETKWQRINGRDAERGEEGAGSCEQVDRVALNMNMDSLSKVTRKNTEYITNARSLMDLEVGRWGSFLVLDSIISLKYKVIHQLRKGWGQDGLRVCRDGGRVNWIKKYTVVGLLTILKPHEFRRKTVGIVAPFPPQSGTEQADRCEFNQ